VEFMWFYAFSTIRSLVFTFTRTFLHCFWKSTRSIVYFSSGITDNCWGILGKLSWCYLDPVSKGLRNRLLPRYVVFDCRIYGRFYGILFWRHNLTTGRQTVILFCTKTHF
jgi:hypothetical protein